MAAVEEELCKLRRVCSAASLSEGLQALSIGCMGSAVSIIGIGEAPFRSIVIFDIAAHCAPTKRGKP